MSKRQLLVVKWEDHTSLSGNDWHSVSEIEKLRPEIVFSAGWVIFEDDKFIILASHGNDDEYCGEMCIMKCAILRRWPIRDPSNS